MLNFPPSCLFFLCVACNSVEHPPELPKTQLEEYTPIVRKFRYGKLDGWIVKPRTITQNLLLLSKTPHNHEVECLTIKAKEAPNTLFVLASSAQKDQAKQYLSNLNQFPVQTQELSCP